MAIVYGVFQKRLYLNQGPEKKGVSDDFLKIFLNPDLHSLAKKNDRSRRLFFSSALIGPFRPYVAIVYSVWGKVAIVYGVWGESGYCLWCFSKKAIPEKKGVSD